MHRRRTPRTVAHRTHVRISNFFTNAASWLVPLLWTLSGIAMIVDLLNAFSWGHVAAWLALFAIGINSHALVRKMTARLTEIIALWQEDVHVVNRPTPLKKRQRASIDENVVVPILSTVVTRAEARTGTDGLN